MAKVTKMTENSKKVFTFLKEHPGEQFLTADIVRELGLTSPMVTGSVTGLVNKGYAIRTEQEISDENDKVKKVKYISITPDGLNFDPDAESEVESAE
jgi:DNA-binding MarR family transcriptional regulator